MLVFLQTVRTSNGGHERPLVALRLILPVDRQFPID